MFAETRQGKRITVYVCGDPFMKGKVVTLNTHEIPGLDRFCSFLTERVPDRRGGYYRRVYTPNGTEVRDLGQIEAGREYVASRDKYRKAAKDFSYSEIPEKTRPIHRKGHNNDITYTPVQHAHDERYRNKSGRSKYLVEHRRGMRLLVHINGGFEKASYPVSILYRDITNYPNIIQEIQQSMGLPQIREVYKVINQGGHRENFVLVTDASMIAQNDHLVVLPKGGAKELIPAVYSLDGKKNFKVPTSPRHGQAYDFPSFPPDNRQYKHNKSLNKHRPLPSIGSSKQSDTMSPYSNPPGSQGGRKTNRSKGRRKEVDYDKDEGGVFRSKQNNARGAHQVNDSKETRTEKPIDQMEAEIVEEEEIHTKDKTTPIPPGTELNKRPSKETKQNADNGIQTKNKSEVKKGGKSGKEMNKVTVLPPIVDKGGKKGSADQTKKGDKNVIKEGVVKETVEKIEGRNAEGVDLEGQFSAEKESTPKDLKTDDVIEMSEREITPVDLKSNDVEVNKPPLSTTPPQGKGSQGSGNVKERVDEDAAAAKIQAGVKGYNARKDYKAKKKAKNREDDNRRLDEEARRREEEALRHEEEELRQAEQDRDRGESAGKKQMDEDKAATKIQASFKGHKARKEYQAKKQQVRDDGYKQSKKEQEIKAVTTIQSGFRGYKVRKEYNTRKKQVKETDINDNEKKDINDKDLGKKEINRDEAAVAIQAGYKGYKTRKEFAQKKAQEKTKTVESKVENTTDNDKEQHKAATQIQANFRGFKARQQYTEKKQQDKVEQESATKIQASFRGYRSRKELSNKKKEPQLPDQEPAPKGEDTEELNKAATKIQSGFRGYKARKNYKAKVNNDHIVETDDAQLPDSAVSRTSMKKGQFIQGIKGDAASKIQSAFRVYHMKKILEQGGDIFEKEEVNVSREAEGKIIAAYRGFRTRKIENEFKEQKTTAAAVKIQAHFKGYKVRKTKFYPMRAVNVFHSAVRGCITRKLNNVQVVDTVKVTAVVNGGHYASVIQALCKGFLTRHAIRTLKERQKSKPKSANSMQGPTESQIQNVAQESDTEVSYWKDTNIKMFSDKTLRKAAARIQSAIYAYKTRNHFHGQSTSRVAKVKPIETDKTEHKGNKVSKIQSSFKGFLERKGKNDVRVEKGKEELAKNEKENLNASQVDVSSKQEKSDLIESSDGKPASPVAERKEILQRSSKEQSNIQDDKVSKNQENETKFLQEPHPPSSSRPVSARPLSSRRIRPGSSRSRSAKNRPTSGRPPSGRPASGQTRSSSKSGSNTAQRGSSGKGKSESSGNLGEADTSVETQLEDDKQISFKNTEKNDAEFPNPLKEETIRSSTRLSGTANSVKSETVLSLSDIDKEQRRSSAKSYSTWKSSEKLKSSGAEVEREGESVREVEDDAGELSSIERNVNAVGQLQAAFRAYKMRREISELMSGGGELMDIRKIDRAVSALRKDFRLRSAKVRRLGSYQFGNDKNIKHSSQNWWENAEDDTDDLQKNEEFQEETDGDDDVNVTNSDTGTNERSDNILKIKAAMKGYKVRKGIKESKNEEEDAKLKIEAAYRGYRTRLTETSINSRPSSSSRGESRTRSVKSAKSRSSAASVRTIFHVQMHSDVINERCTRLQAAFAGYQTRKVFISLSKLVEQNGQSDLNTSGHQLERMGSLSETDDFKLRHKSIAKIQAAYESSRIAHESKKRSRMLSKGVTSPTHLNRHMVLPPIHQDVQQVQASRPKSGILRNEMSLIQVSDGKSKTQPNLYRDYCHTIDQKGLNNIEIYIKKKAAATIIQSHAKAYLTRRKMKANKRKHITGRKTPVSVGRKTPVSVCSKSSRVSKDNKESKDALNRTREDMTMTEMVRVRTASIKLEAERRKVIAEKIRIRQQAEAKEAATEKNAQNEKVVRIKGIESPKALTPIPSSRLATERPNQANDLILREEQAAVKIQKVYRGHKTRQDLVHKAESKKQLENEYGDWKSKRTDAAIAIQSTWRQFAERKEKSDEETTVKDERIKEDFSHLDDGSLLVINIGRSKSEIERANRKYENASMIQMIYRACKIRRKLAIKAAKRRQEKSKAASKIQALYKGHLTRHNLKESASATRIQSVIKAFLARDNMDERERVREEEKQRASSLLQATYLSFRKRRENEALKKERRLNQAAENIQNTGKGFIVRWEHSRKRECNQTMAANKIHSSLLGRKEREKRKVRLEAGVAIMAGFKSYKVRQEVLALKDKLEGDRRAATKLQSAYKAHLVRNSNREYKEKMARQNKAATRIQCSLRGRKARKDYKKQKELMEEKRESAALKIQSVYRGHKGREIARKERKVLELHNISEDIINLILNRTFDYVRRRTDSSERIQATAKGYQTRAFVTSKLSDEAKLRTKAASVIQAAYRAVKERKQTDKTAQRQISASIIQAVFRAKHIRKKQENKKLLKVMNESATKIQALYKGYRCRSEIEKEREMIANIEPPPTALVSARTKSGKLLTISMDEVLMKNSRAIILFHRKATELQAAFKACKTREEMKDRLLRKSIVTKRTPRRVLSISTRLTEEDKAAILIQKTFRGYWNRQVYRNAISQKRKLRDHAATSLQAAVKGYRARMDESGKLMRLKNAGMSEVWRQKQEAANVISFAFRSYQHRKAKKALRVEM